MQEKLRSKRKEKKRYITRKRKIKKQKKRKEKKRYITRKRKKKTMNTSTFVFIFSFIIFVICFLYINIRYKFKQYYYNYDLKQQDLTIQQVSIDFVKPSSVKNALYGLNDLVIIQEETTPEETQNQHQHPTSRALSNFTLVESLLKSFSRIGTELLIHNLQQQNVLSFDVMKTTNSVVSSSSSSSSDTKYLFIALQLNNDATFFLRIMKNNTEHIIKFTNASIIIISFQLFHLCDSIDIISEHDNENHHHLDMNLWIMKDNLMNFLL